MRYLFDTNKFPHAELEKRGISKRIKFQIDLEKKCHFNKKRSTLKPPAGKNKIFAISIYNTIKKSEKSGKAGF